MRLPRPRHAFTLVELVVALAVTSIVMAGLGSVFVLAARGAEASADDQGSSTLAALHAMAAELQDAVRISQASATGVQFEVADRNGDSVNEVISYAWGGSPGNLLVRSYNGNSAGSVGALRDFRLAFETSSRTRTQVSGSTQSAETLLSSYTGAANGSYSVTTTQNVAQVFAPLIPPNATAWSVTRVRVFIMRGAGSGNVLGVQIRTVPGGTTPSSTVLEEWTLATSAMWSGGRWETFNSTLTGLSPSDSLAIVLYQKSGLLSSTAVLSCQTSGIADPDAHQLTALLGGLGGLTWSTYPEASLHYEVYGTYTTPATTTSAVTVYDSAEIRASFQPGPRGRTIPDFATTVRLPIGAEP